VRRSVHAIVGVLALASSACSSTELARYFDEGDYARAAAAYEADPQKGSEEASLYMAGMSYAASARGPGDLDRARTLLGRLLEKYPDSKYRQEATRMLTMVEREQALDERVARLSSTLEELKAIDVGQAALPDGARANEFNQLFERGDWSGVTRAFESEPSLQSSEHALFRAAVAYAVPSNPRHDPARARQLFGLLMNRYPDSVYRDDAAWFTDLLNREIDLLLQIGELEDELESLKAVDLGSGGN
jgi:hypothetical protein